MDSDEYLVNRPDLGDRTEVQAGEFYPVVGVGPHPLPWPTGEQYDPEYLENGDKRNILDQYRYWSVAAIVNELDKRRHPLHIAIENWQHDLNIGSIVRTANAFNAEGVHIIGKRDWNKRGAMVTDKYLHLHHHPTPQDFANWAKENSVPIIGIDNVEGSKELESATLPNPCALLFGQEGPGLSDAAIAMCEVTYAIRQYGSTRSMNASAAGAIAMYAWAMQHLKH
jgi:tRNA G18 (ribose-2'-O)-methylase SpoU